MMERASRSGSRVCGDLLSLSSLTNGVTDQSRYPSGLASFAGEMCRRHSTFIDPKPILQYVSNQLFAGNAKDLVILREMLATMTGVEPLANLSDTQVSSLSGGAALRGEAITPTVPTVKRPPEPGVEERKEAPIEKKGMTNKSSVRLIESLKDSRLTLPLLIVTGQTLDRCLYGVPDAEAHMKSLSTLFDSVSCPFLPFIHPWYSFTQSSSTASPRRSSFNTSTFSSSSSARRATRASSHLTQISPRDSGFRRVLRSTSSGPSSPMI